jgi:hypothetical protein
MNRGFQFHKHRQPFIGTHDETFAIPLRINNENVSPLRVHAYDVAPTPSGFAEIVSDNLTGKAETLLVEAATACRPVA